MLEKNTNLIIGKIDSGKTRGILMPQVEVAISNNENLFILDSKEEYYMTYVDSLKSKGYQVKLLNLYRASQSNGWNPLALPYIYYKKGKVDMATESIRSLATEIFKSNNKNVDQFWENTAADYFTGLTLILLKEAKEEEINLGSLAMLMTAGEKQIGDTTVINKYIASLDPLDGIYITTSPTAFAPPETRGSIIAVMREKLNKFLMREELLNVLNTNEINLNEIEEKTAFFIIGKNSCNSLTSIFLEQVMQSAIINKMSFTFILDNFDTLPNVTELNNLIENATHYNFKVYVAIKDKSEFIAKYDEYIINKFAYILEVTEETELVQVGSSATYPNINKNPQHYFNIENIL